MNRLFSPSFVVLAVALAGLAACKKDQPVVDTLPQEPQLFPNVVGAFIVFPVTEAGASNYFELVIVNGGYDVLLLSNVELSGDPAFSLDELTAASTTIASRESGTIRVNFAPPDRGVYLGQLSIDSNAANLPNIVYDITGPAGASPLVEGPDVVPFEDPVTAAPLEGVNGQIALVRLYNVGLRSAVLSRYAITDDASSAFAFLDGTATPGATCATSAGCGAGAACVDDACAAVILGPSHFVFLAVEYTGSAAATATIEVDVGDPADAAAPPQTLSIGVSGG